VLRPDDEVIVITPCYPSLLAMVEACGARSRILPLDYDNGWQLDVERLASLFTAKTRMLVINSPHNPTGVVFDAETRRWIVELVRRHGCYLLADDVSQGTNPFQADLAHDYFHYEKTLLVSVMSKSFGLGGVRIGWALAREPAMVEMLQAVKAQGSICTSVVDERLALLALLARERIFDRNNRLVVRNLGLVGNFLAEHPELFSWHPPKAGLLALVKVSCAQTMADWCLTTAEKTGVGFLPSGLFGLEGNFVRLGSGRKSFAQGIERLAAWYSSNS